MHRFTHGMSDADKSKSPKAIRNETPSAKMFEDLPSAHLGIVGHSETNRQQQAGQVPNISLPPLPAHAILSQYSHVDFPSSQVAEYDDTKSLLNAGGQYEPPTAVAKRSTPQPLHRRTASRDLLDVDGRLSDAPSQNFQRDNSYDADDDGLPRPAALSNRLRGVRQLSLGPSDAEISAAASYNKAWESVSNAVNKDSPLVSPSDSKTEPSWVSAQKDRPSSDPVADMRMGRVIIEGDKNRKLTFEGASSRHFDNAECLVALRTKGKDTKGKGKEEAFQESEDDIDWETVCGSEPQSIFESQATPRPPFEPYNQAANITDPSVADVSSSGSLSTGKPATPWDPLPNTMARIHPALPGTPHKLRLRKDVSSGETVWVPEYSLPEVGQCSIDGEHFHSAESAEATPHLPEGYPLQISKFSTSTSRQQAIGEDTSSDQPYSSSPPVFPQRHLKANMAVATEKQELAQGRIVHEIEGDEVHCGSGVTNSAEGKQRGIEYNLQVLIKTGNKADIPEAKSVYSLASLDIVQDDIKIVKPNFASRQISANVPGVGVAITIDSSDQISIPDGMRYGEQGGGFEMANVDHGTESISSATFSELIILKGRNFSRNFSGRGENIQPGSSQVSIPFKQRLMSQGRDESGKRLIIARRGFR